MIGVPTCVEPLNNSNILLYGKGVFTTIAISDGQTLFWEKHWKRISDSAVKLGIDVSGLDGAALHQRVIEAIEADGIRDGRARLTIADETPSAMWGGSGTEDVSISILAGERRVVSDTLKLTLSPFLINSTSPLAGLKTCNYLEPLMAAEEAKKRGFDEAVRLNERGEITSACMANIFWLKGGRLYTPSLSAGCLPGTTREFVLENLVCKQVEAGREALGEADDIFLTSAGIGIVQAAEIDGRVLARRPHEILKIFPA